MKRAVMMIAFAFSALHANFSNQKVGGYIQMLRSLDISPHFINDPVFTSIRNRYATKEQRTIDNIMKRGEEYIPYILERIHERGLPPALVYLAMTESHFNPKALSPQKARGLWQFMDKTARRYGLAIDTYVDERMDPYRSTEAALDYLTKLHRMFGKWYLAMLAYNCGEGTLMHAIKRAGTDDLAVLLNPKKRYLPRESRFYVRKIISYALFTRETWEKNYAVPVMADGTLVRVEVGKGETIGYIEKRLGLKRGELRRLNAQLLHGFTSPVKRNYVNLPRRYAGHYKKRYRPGQQKEMFLVHKVQQGEFLGKIAKRYGIHYSMILSFNNMKSTTIRPNDELIIPIPRNNYRPYMVQKGDSLYKIARLFKVDMARLKESNGLESNIIHVGDKLVIPD